jgi:hypothetical protein
MISMHDGQQPTVQKIEQPDMATCQAQAKSVQDQLSFKQTGACRQPGALCTVPYIVRTSCVTGTGAQ